MSDEEVSNSVNNVVLSLGKLPKYNGKSNVIKFLKDGEF